MKKHFVHSAEKSAFFSQMTGPERFHSKGFPFHFEKILRGSFTNNVKILSAIELQLPLKRQGKKLLVNWKRTK